MLYGVKYQPATTTSKQHHKTTYRLGNYAPLKHYDVTVYDLSQLMTPSQYIIKLFIGEHNGLYFNDRVIRYNQHADIIAVQCMAAMRKMAAQ